MPRTFVSLAAHAFRSKVKAYRIIPPRLSWLCRMCGAIGALGDAGDRGGFLHHAAACLQRVSFVLQLWLCLILFWAYKRCLVICRVFVFSWISKPENHNVASLQLCLGLQYVASKSSQKEERNKESFAFLGDIQLRRIPIVVQNWTRISKISKGTPRRMILSNALSLPLS